MPEFHCRPNCGDCCAMVTIHKNVWEKHKDKALKPVKELRELRDSVLPITHDGYCVFLSDDKKCMIYSDRPQVCRDFGEKPLVPCPYFMEEHHVRVASAQLRSQLNGQIRAIRERHDKNHQV